MNNSPEGPAGTVADMLTTWSRASFELVYADTGVDFSRVCAVPSTNPEFGDYQCNAAMSLAKDLKTAPRDIAQSIVDNAPLHESLDRIEVAGPGFINMHIKTEWLARALEQMTANDNHGANGVGQGSTVIMDYGGPNITKTLHIGHLRSPNIGSTLDRLFRMIGYKVISDSHLGDWGTQFGITIMGYRHFGDPAAMARKPMAELERVYVKSYEKSREDPDWLSACRAELVKLQSGDPENFRLWQEFVDLSMHEVDSTYDRLRVRFDLVRGESYYRDKLQNTVDLLKEKGIARESDGAIVAFLEEEKLPPAIVQKSDGGFNYATTDVATIIDRIEEFHPDKIIYIHDERQQLHFRQVFAICNRLGCRVELTHVSFGLMRLPGATFATREGNVIGLAALLDEAEARALAIVKESRSGLAEEQQTAIAREVGIGAVKYADLSQNPQSLVTFTWDKALSLDGNSGPYLQYAYARIASVRNKYTEQFPDIDPETHHLDLGVPIERALALKLVRFPDIVLHAAHDYKPSFLADYLYDLAQTYSTFYQNVPFLKAPAGTRESRVRLCMIVAGILRKGLELLGIDTPERI